MSDLTDGELERKIREQLEKWLTDSKGKAGKTSLSEAEKRVAQVLLPGGNLDRMKRAEEKGCRFRPVPVTIEYKWWWVAGNDYFQGSHRIVRIENGRTIDHRWQHDSLEEEIAALKAKGFRVSRFILAGEPGQKELKKARTSGRKSALNKLATFKAGGAR